MREDEQIINSEFAGVIANNGEVILDSVTNSTLVEKIPVFGTILSVYKVGKALEHIHNLKKLETFIRKIGNGCASDVEISQHVQVLLAKRKNLKDELGLISIILERIIDEEHVDFLAKIYLSYIAKKISWKDFLQFSTIVERFLPGDIQSFKRFVEIAETDDPVLARAYSLGLVDIKSSLNTDVESDTQTLVFGDVERSAYNLTEFGRKFYDSLH